MSEYIVSMSGDWSGKLTEIIRCRDCEHFATNIHGSYCKKSITTLRNPDGFCAWARRKSEE